MFCASCWSACDDEADTCIVLACNSFDALTEANARMRLALEAIKAKCAAPALESDQRDAVHFAYNTADAALKSTSAK